MKKLFFLLLSGLLLCVFSQSLIAGPDEENAVAPAAETIKAKCPKKVSVVLETVKAETFYEYQYYALQAQPGTVAVKSPAIGTLAEVKIGEGSMVYAGQEILAIETISSEELEKLEADVANKKKIWTARLNWKEKSERAIQTAEKSYNEALALLEEKKIQSRLTVNAPATGKVHFIRDLGSQVVAAEVLLEIVNPGRMIYTLSLAGHESKTFTVGQKFEGRADNFQGQAEVIAVSDEQITFTVDNTANLLNQDTAFSLKKLKAEHVDAIAVPTPAILQDNLGDYVYVAEKKRAKKIYVTLGATEAGKTLVKKNLAAGMLLIVSGFDCLAHDKKIRVVNQAQMAKEKAEALAKQKAQKAKAEKKTAAAAEKKPEPKVEEPAEPQLPGIEEFIAYLDANKESLQFERYEKSKIKKQNVLKVFSGLETQKKLLGLISQYAVKESCFEFKGNQVVATIIFKTAEPVAEKKKKPESEDKAGLFGSLLRFAVHGTYYMMLDQNYKDTYVGLSGFGGSLAFRFASKMDFWVSGGLAAKNNTPEWSPVELQFRLTPLAAALRYYFLEKGKLSAFAGAGANVFLVKDMNPIEDIKKTLIGFNALAGGYYKLSRKVFAQLFLKFNMVQKDIYPDSDIDDPLNLTGLELNLGVGILL